jgi:hypothetical protein
MFLIYIIISFSSNYSSLTSICCILELLNLVYWLIIFSVSYVFPNLYVILREFHSSIFHVTYKTASILFCHKTIDLFMCYQESQVKSFKNIKDTRYNFSIKFVIYKLYGQDCKYSICH